MQKAELHGLYFSLLISNHMKEIETDEERGTHGGLEIPTQDMDEETCRKETTWDTWHRWDINTLPTLVLKK